MSGIYIPGIEFPDDCLHCPCADLEYMDCNLMPGSGIGYKKRLDDCPLFPVPEHGRLIDADEFFKALTMDDCVSILEAMHVQSILSDAPTVIPASKEGEE